MPKAAIVFLITDLKQFHFAFLVYDVIYSTFLIGHDFTVHKLDYQVIDFSFFL